MDGDKPPCKQKIYAAAGENWPCQRNLRGSGQLRTYLIFDKSGEGEVVEEVGEVTPNVGIPVFAEALVVEAIHLCDLARLVVAADEVYVVGVVQFEGIQIHEALRNWKV